MHTLELAIPVGTISPHPQVKKKIDIGLCEEQGTRQAMYSATLWLQPRSIHHAIGIHHTIMSSEASLVYNTFSHYLINGMIFGKKEY
jgi:hypothetical protein